MAQSANKCSTSCTSSRDQGDLSCSTGGMGCKKVSASFSDSRIVPDAVDHVPEDILTVEYDSNNCVDLGKELMPAQVISQPKVSWVAKSDNQLYTVVELDLDAPSRADPSLRSVLHWLIYDVPGNDVSRGREYAAYMGSAPFPKSGLHRYVFLVFPQNGPLSLPPLVPTPDMSERLRFDMKNFIRQNNLGQPIAGNFFLAQADAYATEFWSKRNP